MLVRVLNPRVLSLAVVVLAVIAVRAVLALNRAFGQPCGADVVPDWSQQQAPSHQAYSSSFLHPVDVQVAVDDRDGVFVVGSCRLRLEIHSAVATNDANVSVSHVHPASYSANGLESHAAAAVVVPRIRALASHEPLGSCSCRSYQTAPAFHAP